METIFEFTKCHQANFLNEDKFDHTKVQNTKFRNSICRFVFLT